MQCEAGLCNGLIFRRGAAKTRCDAPQNSEVMFKVPVEMADYFPYEGFFDKECLLYLFRRFYHSNFLQSRFPFF